MWKYPMKMSLLTMSCSEKKGRFGALARTGDTAQTLKHVALHVPVVGIYSSTW
jgi:hypothetical protein